MKRPRWQKVIRDLWSQKARTMLVVLAISVGVLAFASVFITREVLIADMTSQYQLIRPASLYFSIEDFDEKLVSWVKHQPGVVDAQGRTVRSVKITKGESSESVALYSLADFDSSRINQVFPEKGQWPPDSRQLVLERASAQKIGVEIGENLTIELPTGRERELIFSGTVHDLNAIPPIFSLDLTGFVSQTTLNNLGLSTKFNRLEVVTESEFNQDIAGLEKLGDELKEKLEDNGWRVGSVRAQKPTEHWGEENSRAFVAILAGVGSFSLVLSGFLVMNIIFAVIAQQKRQIGMMKAVGATGRQILALYLVMILAYGFLAFLLAIPLGLGLAWLNLLAVSQFLNLDIVNFRLPGKVLLMEIAAALLVPVLAASIPLRGGMRVTVREAISDYGLARKKKIGWLDSWIGKVRRLPRPVLLSLRNTFRRQERLFLTLGALVIAGALFMGVVNARGSMFLEQEKISQIYNYDVIFFLNQAYRLPALVSRAKQVPGVVKASGQIAVSGQRVKEDGSLGGNFAINGIIPEDNFVTPASLDQGRWLQKEDKDVLVISHQLLEDDSGFAPGKRVEVKIDEKKYDFEIVGMVRLVGEENNLAYAPFDRVGRLAKKPKQASVLYVRTDQLAQTSQSQVAEEIEERLKRAGFGVSRYLTVATIQEANAGLFDFMIGFLLSMAVLVAVVGALGLAGTMSLNVLERTREIGIMRSIGASNAIVRRVVVVESLIIGLISWLAAIPLSVPISWGFAWVIGRAFFGKPLSFVFLPSGPGFWLVLMMMISFLASLLPARRAVRMKIQETLAYE